jgi:regulator of protease activity HflC (stomatin/prohibitin superfamily)
MALKLSNLIDRFYNQQEAVKEKQRDVTRAEAARDKEKAKLDKIGNEILDRFEKDKIEGHKTALAQANLKRIVGPSVVDWNKLAAYVYKNKALSLMQRRINKATWLEHLEERKGRPLPGVKKFERVTLSVTKAKK